tara:strand:- start:626 stop:1084 length:459 start_codon:yes stop_codon:yes gene_type:complete
MKLLSKINAKDVIGSKIGKKTEITKLIASGALLGFNVYGLVKSKYTVTTQYGDAIGFKGGFEAANFEDGEISRSGKMFLPAIAGDLLEQAVDSMTEDQTELKFGFKIGLKASEKGNTGYEFTVEPLIDTTENDPISDMRSEFALPAPKPAKK